MSHNSLVMSYCQIPAKRTGISRKTSALIEGRNRMDREVPACFARGGMGRYGTLKLNIVSQSCEWIGMGFSMLLRIVLILLKQINIQGETPTLVI